MCRVVFLPCIFDEVDVCCLSYYSTIIIELNCEAVITDAGDVRIQVLMLLLVTYVSVYIIYKC